MGANYEKKKIDREGKNEKLQWKLEKLLGKIWISKFSVGAVRVGKKQGGQWHNMKYKIAQSRIRLKVKKKICRGNKCFIDNQWEITTQQ